MTEERRLRGQTIEQWAERATISERNLEEAQREPKLEAVGIFHKTIDGWFEIADRDIDKFPEACFLYRELP